MATSNCSELNFVEHPVLGSLSIRAHYADDDGCEVYECEDCEECENCEEYEDYEEFQPGGYDYEVYDYYEAEGNTVHSHTNIDGNDNLDSLKQKVLKMHNEFRKKVSKGEASDLVWDKSLEALGQKMSDECLYGYLSESELRSYGYGKVGQNIAYDRDVELDFEQWTKHGGDPRHYNQVSVRETKKSDIDLVKKIRYKLKIEHIGNYEDPPEFSAKIPVKVEE
ncbi:hypothetical protein ACTXT7_014001 [Hymenolepis weldensis]